MRTVMFICLHGAGRSRLAAALFNQASPDGWRATTAGLEPDPVLSPNAERLLAGTDALPFLDRDPPRAVAATAEPARIVAIDCDVPGAERWTLSEKQMTEALRDEIAGRVAGLSAELAGG